MSLTKNGAKLNWEQKIIDIFPCYLGYMLVKSSNPTINLKSISGIQHTLYHHISTYIYYYIFIHQTLLFYNSMGWISLRSRKALRCLGFQAGQASGSKRLQSWRYWGSWTTCNSSFNGPRIDRFWVNWLCYLCLFIVHWEDKPQKLLLLVFVGVMGGAVLRLRSFCPNAGQ